MQKILGTSSNSEEDLEKAVVEKAQLEGDEKNRILTGFKWLGLFSSTPATPRGTPLDTLCATLEAKMEYGPNERDLVFLQHRFEIENKDSSKKTVTSTGVWFGEPNGVTAMARTVGVPCGVATQLILDGELEKKASEKGKRNEVRD